MPRETSRMSYSTWESKSTRNGNVDGSKDPDRDRHRIVQLTSREKERLKSPNLSRRRMESSRSRSRSVSRSRRHEYSKTKSRYSPHRTHRLSSRSRSRSVSRHRKLEKCRVELSNSSDIKFSSEKKIKDTSVDSDKTDLDDKNSGVKSDTKIAVLHRSFERDFKGGDASIKMSKDDIEEPVDKEKIHKEIEEKLRLALAKEGKIYPPPKPEASHPIFANDGSFLELFKKMQEQTKKNQQDDNANKISKPLCKRRGGKILKTGIVTKPRADNLNNETDPKDFWSIYLQEVKKYKSSSCDIESKTRPLVK